MASTDQFDSGFSNYPPDSLNAGSVEAGAGTAASRPSDDVGGDGNTGNTSAAIVRQLRSALNEANRRNGALAEAVVSSAEIIEELEQTRQELAEARRQAEMSALQTQLLSDRVFEQTHDAVLVLRDDFSCLSANRNATELFAPAMIQSERDDSLQAIGQVFESLETADWIRETRSRLASTGSARFELCRRQSARSRQWLEVSFSSFQLLDRKRYLVIGHDITDRKEFELALRRSHDFLTHTLNAIPDLICVRQGDLTPVLVNSSFREASTSGTWSASSILNETVRLSPTDQRVEKQRFETQEQDEERSACPDTNETRVFSTRRSMFRDPVTNDPFFVSASRDITRQLVSEDRVRLLASVFENTREGVVVLNLDGTICEANPEFCRISGRASQELAGIPLNHILNWDNQEMHELVRMTIRGTSRPGRVRLSQRPDVEADVASIYWGSLGVSRNESGEPVHLIAILSDITQIERTQKKLQKQARHDNLTGLPNRRFFVEQMEALIQQSGDSNGRFGICFLDLDDFKIVNDTLGHEAGDRLLIEVTKRLKQSVFRDCFLARFGGDEFALLVPETPNRSRVESVTREIVNALNEPFQIGEQPVFVGVSIGTTWYPEDADSPDELLRRADLAMYHAKDVGKNTVREFSPELAAQIEFRQSMLSRLRMAIDREELFLAFQAKVSLETKSVAGCEALVRWQDQGEMISPGAFIDLAERSGLIRPLGDQVLRMVMGHARQWQEQGVFSGPIGVNLSPRQLADPAFASRYEALLAETGCQPEWIELELTENAMMQDLTSAMRLMERIHSLGTHIAIDDFGSGYSSLNYLKSFPVSTLKIDLSFIRDVPHDPRAVAVTRTVLSLGHGLGINVVAEGVERRDQLEFLKETGCDQIQGYYLHKPARDTEFVDWLRTNPCVLD